MKYEVKAELLEKLIEKQRELIEALDGQVELLCGEKWKDAEGYGYSAIALSKTVAQTRFEISELENQLQEPVVQN